MTKTRSTATPSELVAAAIVRTRKRRGWSALALAERCRVIGVPDLTTAVIANIETGRPGPDGKRRREVSVDELFALAAALDVSPLSLLLPVDSPVTTKVSITATITTTLFQARSWLRWQAPLPGQSAATYYDESPADEYRLALQRRLRQAKTRAERAEVEAILAAYTTTEEGDR